MKRLIVIGLAAGLWPAAAMAAGNHPMGGCGLGYLLFSNKDNSKATQVLGATTNGTFGSQTFGISSGTSGCTEDGAVKMVKETEIYADVNLDLLRREMAAGQGETVETFAGLLGVSEAKRPELVRFFRDHYARLFPTSETGASEMIRNLAAALAAHREIFS